MPAANCQNTISCVLGKVAQFTFIFRLFLYLLLLLLLFVVAAVRLSCDCRPSLFLLLFILLSPFLLLLRINSATKAAICFHLSVLWMRWTRAKNLIRPVLCLCERSRNHSGQRGMPHTSCTLQPLVYAAIKFN